jgi:hypothetical protein
MATARVGKSPVNKNRMARPPTVELPGPRAETDPPRMWRLTAVIAVCFSLGVAWPTIGGLDFVHRPPGNGPRPLDGELPPTELDPSAPGQAAPLEVPAARATPLVTTRQAVSIEGRKVQSCQGDGGERVTRCDSPNLDGVIDEPLAKLAECAGVGAAAGVLSLGLHLDFSRGRVTRVKAGQSSTLPTETSTRLIECAEDVVVGTALDDVEHEHGRYWVYYRVRFLPPGSPIEPVSSPADALPTERQPEASASEAAEPTLVSASGQATIGWTTAVVRESPSPRAKVATELSYGTRVNVTGRLGDWYRIERLGKSLGWIHRQAIGL